jgi:hypothetical protein
LWGKIEQATAESAEGVQATGKVVIGALLGFIAMTPSAKTPKRSIINDQLSIIG